MNLNQLVNGKKGEKLFLLGNEAAVRGAIEAGVGVSATYPGTPSSEIGNVLSIIAKDTNMYFEFSINEKVAMEIAASAAASGVRSFTFMKHVGLNVASDSFMSAVYTGVTGGMVVLVADDPSMFSSQNEQDSRHYAHLANLPVLEPSNPQEIKDMVKYGFELSEQFNIPVLVRTTTRTSHMRGIVELSDVASSSEVKRKGFFNKDVKKFVPVPAYALDMHKKLVAKMDAITNISNDTSLNYKIDFNNSCNGNNEDNNNGINCEDNKFKVKLGIISSSSAFNYAYDTINRNNLDMELLKIGLSYPICDREIISFIDELDGVIVIEEVDPIMEKEVLAIIGQNNIPIHVYGKLDGTFPMIYEYTPDIVKESLAKVFNDIDNGSVESSSDCNNNINNNNNNDKDNDSNNDNGNGSNKSKLINKAPKRPPTLCAGCSHRSTYYAIRQATNEMDINKEDLIFPSDIGCYTLGVESPYEMADYLLSMGSSIGDACGFSKATDQYTMAFLGDSTFFHAGIAPLVNGVHNNHKFVVTILDNRITAMTGGQPNPGLPIDGMGNPAPEISIEKLVEGCGVKFIEVINPLNLRKTVDTYKQALNYDGVAVIIARYPCTLIKGQKRKRPMEIKADKCIDCRDCLNNLACPAISIKDDKVTIDSVKCKGCTTCVQMCPNKAIGVKKE
ncbi:MAG: indolepyruvate ferredoxin oxidoreductase subunit alpha [Methanobacteriaceae archaeon]